MNCEECQSGLPSVVCTDCDQVLCINCDSELHHASRRRFHYRPPVCSSCRVPPISNCKQCEKLLCQKCSKHHKGHPLTELSPVKRVGVYWDLQTCKPFTKTDVFYILQEVSQSLGAIVYVKTYGDRLCNIHSGLPKDANLINMLSLNQPDVLLMDMAYMKKYSITQFLLISSSAEQMKEQLMLVTGATVYVSMQILPLVIEDLKTIEGGRCRIRYYTDGCSNPGSIGNAEASAKLEIRRELVRFLKETAYKGRIMHEIKTFIQEFADLCQLDGQEVGSLIRDAHIAGEVVIANRDLPLNIEYQYIGIKVSKLNIECLLWALRSLKLDEMLPSEKAIHSRIKEAFDLKVNSRDWQTLLEETQSSSKEYTLFCNSQTLFDIKEVAEPGGSQTVLIYPTGEEWATLDQHSKFGDYLNLKSDDIWDEFLHFLRGYYGGGNLFPLKHENEAPRTIPGGRYGCAQFLKISGPERLRQASLGKLSYLIQLALNENTIRYQRTFVVWAKDFKQENASSKLVAVKSAIITLLKENSEGISLARMPQFLKKFLPFTLSIGELGFAKLKDLLAVMPEIVLEIRTTTHSHATLISQEKIEILNSAEVQAITAIISDLMEEHKSGLIVEEGIRLIELKLQQTLKWEKFQVTDLKGFLLTYTRNLAKIEENMNISPVQLITSGKKNNDALWVPTPHLLLGEVTQTSYEDGLKEYYSDLRRTHSDKAAINESIRVGKPHHSWVETWGLRPPPGFE